MVREYLRVSCHDKNDTGGTPTALEVTKGGREALEFAAGGVTSLIVPFVEGSHAEATLSWTDKAYPLTLDWPKGSKMPTVLGSFAGARSPLDGTAAGDSQKLCDCHKKVTGAKTCEDVFGEANADCDRTYGSNCEKLLGCARGEPGAGHPSYGPWSTSSRRVPARERRLKRFFGCFSCRAHDNSVFQTTRSRWSPPLSTSPACPTRSSSLRTRSVASSCRTGS